MGVRNLKYIVAIQAVTLFFAVAGLAETPPQAEPLVVELDIPSGKLHMDQVGDYYISQAPVMIRAGSIIPRWRISCEAGQAVDQAGSIIDADRFEIIFESNKLNSGLPSKGEPINLGYRSVLVEGGITGPRMLDVCSFYIRAEIDPYTPAGYYRGEVRIDPEIPGAAPQRGYVIPYEFQTVELLAVDVLTDMVDFGSQVVGTFDNRAPAVFWIYSNHHESVIDVHLTQMENPETGALLPNDSTLIGWGNSPAEARNNALNLPFGANDLSITVGPGQHKIAVHARLQLTTEALAGNYSGRIEITSRVNF